MAHGFNGFTDVDLEKVYDTSLIDSDKFDVMRENVKINNSENNEKTVGMHLEDQEKILFVIPDDAKLSDDKTKINFESIPQDVMSSKMNSTDISWSPTKTTKETLIIEGPKDIRVVTEHNIELSPKPKLVLQSNFIDTLPPKLNIKNINDTIPSPSLEEFEERRKQLEIKNQQTKDELFKALCVRAEKKKEEVMKLAHIESELKSIDASLSTDISIIRQRIEKTSLIFLDAQKRFDKAEKEYNAALKDLLKEKEKKMLLTSHLCSIIEQNEIKKAEKLTELWTKFELTSSDDPNSWTGYEETDGEQTKVIEESN